jgi:hypothetical protein
MRDLTLRRWLSVLLAQRSFLTEEEEGQVVEAYFTRGENDSGLSFTAYERVKRNFLQPIGDRPSFPVHYRMTLRAIRRADTFMTSEDPEHFHPIDSGEGRLVSLKGLRRQEPSLHRALLYRLAKGSIRPERINGRVYVAAGVVDEVEQARQENSRSRLPKRLPHGRHRWIALMMRSGIKRRSAERKLKRWINVLGLSEAEIEASAAKGSLVRLPPFR